jgi:hypothetical protein
MPTRPLKIALAGNSDLPLDRTARHVVPWLLKAGTVLLRHPKTRGRPIGGFERMTAKIAETLGVEVEWCVPEGSEKGNTFTRDLDMVGKADFVICFFTTDQMDGGTGHVVEAAMAKGIPVQGWWIDADGEAVRIGEYDPSQDGP